MHRVRFFACLLSAATPWLTPLAPKVAHAAPSATQQAEQAAFDDYFGLYIGGQKVGFLHAWLQATPSLALGYELVGQVGGMGQKANVRMREERRFGSATGELQSLHFVQQAPTGSVVVTGKRRGRHMALSTHAGGAQRRHDTETRETLADHLAAWRLAGGGGQVPQAVGSKQTIHHLDPVSGQTLPAEVIVEAIEPRLVGGIPNARVHVVTNYPNLAVRERSVYDGHGQLLRTQVGGFFEARREEQRVAQAAIAPGDLLLDAVLAVPKPLQQIEGMRQMRLQLSGLGEIELPHSPRQDVTTTGQRVSVALRLDGPWPNDTFKDEKKRARQHQPPEVAEALLPTAFVQSDAPALRAYAMQAIGQAHSSREVVEALVAAVQSRLRSEYVPAFSNALEAFHSRRGDCTEYSVLFVALARAIGLPARVAVGFAYWPPGNGFGWHAWSEVFVGGTWRSVDATWSQAQADVSHVKVAQGDPLAQARVAMLLGQVRIEALEASP